MQSFCCDSPPHLQKASRRTHRMEAPALDGQFPLPVAHEVPKVPQFQREIPPPTSTFAPYPFGVPTIPCSPFLPKKNIANIRLTLKTRN